jgi:2-polyprenyl-6-hydroxyphenyl methylase / 3-demethylubiquinone-9 3-methyltransferase
VRGAARGSVSPSEVDKFSAMDAAWWDPVRNPLLGMNATRVQYIREQLAMNETNQDQDRPVRVLDVGCGGGLLCESLSRLLLRAQRHGDPNKGAGLDATTTSCRPPAAVVGIDPSSKLIDVAKKHALLDPKTSNIEYHCTTVEEFAAAAASEGGLLFDVVCLLEVVEHVNDSDQLDSMLSCISKLMRNDGLLFVSTVNKTFKSHVLTIFGAEYVMRYLPVGTHQWHLYKSPQDVEHALAPHRLRPVNVCGVVLTSIPLPVLPAFLSPPWEWKLDPSDVDVNWIGTYRKQ